MKNLSFSLNLSKGPPNKKRKIETPSAISFDLAEEPSKPPPSKIPTPDSFVLEPSVKQKASRFVPLLEKDKEEDSLDKFMKNLVEDDQTSTKPKSVVERYEEEDRSEVFKRRNEEEEENAIKNFKDTEDSFEEFEDVDDFLTKSASNSTTKKTFKKDVVEMLKKIDHSKENYHPFKKNNLTWPISDLKSEFIKENSPNPSNFSTSFVNFLEKENISLFLKPFSKTLKSKTSKPTKKFGIPVEFCGIGKGFPTKNEEIISKFPIENIIPLKSFSDLKIHPEILQNLKKLLISKTKLLSSGTENDGFGFTPTQIQKICIPAVLYGLDFIGISSTGSGKTIAYLIPLILHLRANMKQNRQLRDLNLTQSSTKSTSQHDNTHIIGPFSLILLPTRELVHQVSTDLNSLLLTTTLDSSSSHKISTIELIGGKDKKQQFSAFRSKKSNGIDVVIATPGRLLDLLVLGAFSLKYITFVVIDEFDKMFDFGFENQIRAILSQIRIDKQISFFSATLNKKVISCCKSYCNPEESMIFKLEVKSNEDEAYNEISINEKILQEPIVVTIERDENGNEDFESKVGGLIDLEEFDAKWNWCEKFLESFYLNEVLGVRKRKLLQQKLVLIFCDGHLECEMLEKTIQKELLPKLQQKQQDPDCYEIFKENEFPAKVASFHGNKTQEERDFAIKNFKSGTIQVLVATDVAARGLDIPNIGIVINFSVPKDIQTYVHRIGRTARKNLNIEGDQDFNETFTILSEKDSKFAAKFYKFLKNCKKSEESLENLKKLAEKSEDFAKIQEKQKFEKMLFGKDEENEKPIEKKKDGSEIVKSLEKVWEKNAKIGEKNKKIERNLGIGFQPAASEKKGNLFLLNDTFVKASSNSSALFRDEDLQGKEFVVIEKKKPKKQENLDEKLNQNEKEKEKLKQTLNENENQQVSHYSTALQEKYPNYYNNSQQVPVNNSNVDMGMLAQQQILYQQYLEYKMKKERKKNSK